MKKKILFIIHDLYQSDNIFPLSIGYLSSMLRNFRHADITIYNQDLYHYSLEDLSHYLNSHTFDAICLGFFADRFKRTIIPLSNVISKCKKNAKFIIGGGGPSPIPEYMIDTIDADIVACGEADTTILDIYDYMDSEKSLDDIPGIVYKDSENIITRNIRRNPITDLDSLPYPAWDLFPLNDYLNNIKYSDQLDNENHMPVASSRGCTNTCAFCYRLMHGYRKRSIENFVQEIKYLYDTYHVKYFNIFDELFIFNLDRLFEFEELLDKYNLKIKYRASGRADVFDYDISKCLVRTGCQLLSVGMESLDQNVLDDLHKCASVDDNYKITEIAKDTNLSLGYNFMWATPKDTFESLDDIVKFLLKYNDYKQLRTIRPVTPYPGSPLYYRAMKLGLLDSPEDFFKKFTNQDRITINFTDMKISDMYKALYKANKILIKDHFNHTIQDNNLMTNIINSYYSLYFKNDFSFTGARHYSNK